jgi:hypothetical protein
MRRSDAKTVETGVTDENSAGTVVFLSPGLRYSIDKWSAFMLVGIPIIDELNGSQAEPEWRLFTGLAVSFDARLGSGNQPVPSTVIVP